MCYSRGSCTKHCATRDSTPTICAVLMSKLLDLHLSRAIEKHKRPLPPTREAVMRKFFQLAEDIETDLRELDADADALQERRKAVKERARQAVNAQHRVQDRIEEGLKAMEAVVESLERTNSQGNEERLAEGGGNSAETFQPGTPGKS